jgi:hypothetical protein
MKTVFALVVTYFTRTPGLRWFTLSALIGFVLIALGPWLFKPMVDADVAGAIGDVTAFLSGCSFFLGAGLMPHMVGRLATSHAIYVLPYGRLKLFLSALITVFLVAVPIPTLFIIGQLAQTSWHTIAQFTFWENVKILSAMFGDVYPTVFLAVSWLYLAIYFVTSDRSLGGLAKSLLVVIALIYVPTQRIVRLDPMFPWTSFEVAVTWVAFAAWLFLVPQLKRARARRGSATPQSSRYAPGREFELMLGTARPWLLALAMLFPIVIQTLVGFQLPETWLFYLTLFSVVAGGLAGRAAERSRAIWLRARWTREQLFAHVEAAFWKHNSLSLVALLVLLAVVARVYNLPPRVIPLGLPLLVIAMVVSMYLGLMMTRGLRWIESSIAIVVMLALMGVAVMAAREANDARTVVVLEALFAGLAIVLRFVARARWHRIDWMLCRVERSDVARTGA